MLKGTSSESHSRQVSMENLGIRDDTEGHNRAYQLGNSNGHIQTPDPRTNNADVLLDGQLRISENTRAVPLTEGKSQDCFVKEKIKVGAKSDQKVK